MARRPAAADERQTDFFGRPAPAAPEAASTSEPATPGATRRPAAAPRPRSGPGQDAKRRPPHPDRQEDVAGIGGSPDALAARLSPAELNELTAALPDDALAHLILAAARQLRRRLARGGGGRGGKKRASVLERAARQVATELGGGLAGGDDA